MPLRSPREEGRGRQKLGARGWKVEARSQQIGGSRQKTEDRSQKLEARGGKAEARRQKIGGGRQKTEDRRQQVEDIRPGEQGKLPLPPRVLTILAPPLWWSRFFRAPSNVFNSIYSIEGDKLLRPILMQTLSYSVVLYSGP